MDMPCQVTLVHTAGLCKSGDAIEVADMESARSAMRNVYVIALVLDCSALST